MPPHFEDVEALRPVGGIADRREDFDRLVDFDAAIGPEVKRQELLRLLDRRGGAAVRLRGAAAGD